MSLDCRDRFIFANFIEPSQTFYMRKGLSSRERERKVLFQSRIDEIVYSFDAKIAISDTRKQSCMKNHSRTALVPVYKLRGSLKKSCFRTRFQAKRSTDVKKVIQ